jgi:hypothetical protein
MRMGGTAHEFFDLSAGHPAVLLKLGGKRMPQRIERIRTLV